MGWMFGSFMQGLESGYNFGSSAYDKWDTQRKEQRADQAIQDAKTQDRTGPAPQVGNAAAPVAPPAGTPPAPVADTPIKVDDGPAPRKGSTGQMLRDGGKAVMDALDKSGAAAPKAPVPGVPNEPAYTGPANTQPEGGPTTSATGFTNSSWFSEPLAGRLYNAVTAPRTLAPDPAMRVGPATVRPNYLPPGQQAVPTGPSRQAVGNPPPNTPPGGLAAGPNSMAPTLSNPTNSMGAKLMDAMNQGPSAVATTPQGY